MRLITSPFNRLFETKKKKLLLGDWCVKSKNYDNCKHNTIRYHWENRKKFKNDFVYLEGLVYRVNKELSYKLNKIHNTNYSQQFWFLLTNPWVSMFVSAVFDRWTSMNNALNNYKISEIYFLDFENNKPPKTFNDYLNLYNNHYWNHNLFRDISDFLNIKLVKICSEKKKIEEVHFIKKIVNISLLKKIIDKFLSYFEKKQKVIFIDHYFHIFDFIKISLAIRQLPRFYNQFYKKVDLPSENISLRENFKLNLKKTKFESFLSEYIFKNLPISLLEGFTIMLENAEKINLNSNVVITGNSNFPTELCKFWVACQSEKKTKIILNEHGGSIPTKYRYYDIHNKIFKKQISWSKNKSINVSQLTPSKLIRLKNLKLQRKKISIITLETAQYAYYCQNLQSSLINEDYEQKKLFMKKLNQAKINFFIKPYNNKGWCIKERYINEFGKEKILNKDLISVIKESKLVICTYPETTFLESMISGVPTILLYLEKYWEFDKNFSSLVHNLKKNKIIFSDANLALNHIKKIKGKEEEWWQSEKISRVRNQFLKNCGDISPEWISEWKKFIHKQRT